jgi:uncharacterized protein YdcH (DUF465 family)
MTRDSDEYRGLMAQHRDFELRLSELDKKRFLSSQEQIERTNLKKYKLRVKDRIAALVRELAEPRTS